MRATMAYGARRVVRASSQHCFLPAGKFGFRLAGSGRKLDVHGCARAERTLDLNRSAERLDTVSEPDQAGASCRIRAAGAVVPDGDANHSLDRPHADTNDRGLGVL